MPGGRAAFDATRPNVARVYDYWLGGKDHYAADRAEAGRRAWLPEPVIRHRDGHVLAGVARKRQATPGSTARLSPERSGPPASRNPRR